MQSVLEDKSKRTEQAATKMAADGAESTYAYWAS